MIYNGGRNHVLSTRKHVLSLSLHLLCFSNSAKSWRKASGEKSFVVYRSNRNRNDLTIFCRWDTAARMQKFVKSAELKRRMMDAGVISKPELYFFSKAEDLSV